MHWFIIDPQFCRKLTERRPTSKLQESEQTRPSYTNCLMKILFAMGVVGPDVSICIGWYHKTYARIPKACWNHRSIHSRLKHFRLSLSEEKAALDLRVTWSYLSPVSTQFRHTSRLTWPWEVCIRKLVQHSVSCWPTCTPQYISAAI